MALKKSELYYSLWQSCDALRGGMDASQYKDYVLVLLFVKYVSDKYAGQPFAPITIPPGASFADLNGYGSGQYQAERVRIGVSHRTQGLILLKAQDLGPELLGLQEGLVASLVV